MTISPTLQIVEASMPRDADTIRKLWVEYLTWGNDLMLKQYGVHPHHPKEQVELDIQNIEKFMPPKGRLLLAYHNEKACGIGCLKSINNEIGEIKRMYVDPNFRNIGAGRGILQALINSAREAGYKAIRLDSIKFMEAAHTLYRSIGFIEIPAYPESEIPEEFRQYLIFMELKLD